MVRFVIALLVSIVLGFPTQAQSPNEGAMQSVIAGQLQAFAKDDAAEAYDYAAPLIQQIFPTTGQFMAMVKQGYQPVYRNNGYEFGASFLDSQGNPAQRVYIAGADGKQYEAVYTMQQQTDGTWKIAGCYLTEVPGAGA